jgi:hypothetical protein
MHMTGKSGLLILIISIYCLSCSDDPSLVGSAFKSPEPSFGIAFVDTMTVKASTILIDSLPTSFTGHLLVGKYTDATFGTVESTAYVQFGNSNTWNVDDDATFDSVVLIMPFSDLWYGDTTRSSTLSAYQVTETFQAYTLPLYWIDEGVYPYFNYTSGLFNTSDITYQSSPLGSRTFRPRPTSTDSIRIRLSSTLGERWLNEAKLENNYFSSVTEFQKVFQGIALRETSASPSSVYGIDGSNAKIRIYYKNYVSGVLTSTWRDLTYSSTYYQYNKISGNRTNTLLEPLTATHRQVLSAATNEETFVQSGIGIFSKIEFPHVKQLLNSHENIIINNAFLVIEPVYSSFSNQIPLPELLTLFHTDQNNYPIAPLYYDYGTDQQMASITVDREYGTTSGYKFSITEYIQQLVSNSYTNKPALLLSTPLSELQQSVSRACLGSGQHPDYQMRLEIYYTYAK